MYIPKLQLAVKNYIGLPYLHSEQITENTKVAFNCWSFIRQLYMTNFDIDLHHNILVNAETFIEVWNVHNTTPIESIVHEWDMALIRTNNVVVDHAGLVIYPDKIVHCTPLTGVCIEPMAKYRNTMFQIVRLQSLL